MAERADEIGTIAHTRKMLAFLETLPNPGRAARELIRRYRIEVEAYEYGRIDRDPEETGSVDRANAAQVTATLATEVEAEEGRSSPTGSLPSPSDFHDVSGANI